MILGTVSLIDLYLQHHPYIYDMHCKYIPIVCRSLRVQNSAAMSLYYKCINAAESQLCALFLLRNNVEILSTDK